MGPQCGGDAWQNPKKNPKEKSQEKSHDVYFGFCPAKSQLYRFVVKPVAQQSLKLVAAYAPALRVLATCAVLALALGRRPATG
jgi:hypothetical protein